MWDFPGSGIKLESLASAGGFLTTGHQGSPERSFLYYYYGKIHIAKFSISVMLTCTIQRHLVLSHCRTTIATSFRIKFFFQNQSWRFLQFQQSSTLYYIFSKISFFSLFCVQLGYIRGWDGLMASLTRWKWVWVNSGSWCWIGRPGVLRFMGSQRVGHDWVTDLIWSEDTSELPNFEDLLMPVMH